MPWPNRGQGNELPNWILSVRYIKTICSFFTTYGPIPGVPGGTLYEKFGMADNSSPGVAVLVRPDGHVSMITGLESENADKILSFIYNL